jgi:hypothetical protein
LSTGVRLVATLAAALVGGQGVLARPAPVELVFLDAPASGTPLVDVPRLAVSANGGPVRAAVVDTGSTGVLLSAAAIPDLDRLPQLGPGTLTYSSSGRIMRGRWVMTALTIAGRTGKVATRPMPVLAVQAIACTPSARRCVPEDRPLHVAMLGIGFGRAHDGQAGAGPARNPLLNIAAPAQLPRSYAISRTSIRLGAAADGYTLVTLSRTADGTDWAASPACIALNGGAPACGTVLVDTGLTGMFLTVPPDRLPAGDPRTLAPGTRIDIDLTPDHAGAGLHLAVRVGDPADAAAPTAVTLSGVGQRPPFVNTGVRFLNRFEYRYDADIGTVGYRPVGQ